MRMFCLVLLMVLATSCSRKLDQYVSTYTALDEYSELLSDYTYYIYPQVREKPVHWFDSIPTEKIINYDPTKPFNLNAQPGEYFVYQVAVWAIKSQLKDVQVEFTDLNNSINSEIISADAMTCFNTEGVDFEGNRFSKKVDVDSNRVQSMWMGIDLKGVSPGIYLGSVSINCEDERQTISLRLKVSGEIVSDHGYNQGRRLSRLNWLNSTAGINEKVTRPYDPVQVSGNRIEIFGRTLTLSKNGLPESIISYFNGSNQSINDIGEPIITEPFRFVVDLLDKPNIPWEPGKIKIIEHTSSKVVWSVLNTSATCDLEVIGQMEFDGFVEYHLRFIPKVPLSLSDIRLEVPMEKEKALYMMGLGHEGGLRTKDWKWNWDITKNQDMLWMGGVNGGLRLKWKAENYKRPLVNIYYKFSPLALPPSWGNEGKGGVDVLNGKENVLIKAYSGQRNIQKDEILNFDFELLITPLKILDRNIKYNDRYYHGGGTNTSLKIEKAKESGANIVNIHHAEDIYPFINYPFLDKNVEELTNLVRRAHEENLRMKFYYTTRELTKNIPEFWAFYSLDGEIIYPGPGNASRTEALHPNGPNEWLIKNLREKYIPAWYNEIKEGPFKGEIDLSVITTPDSRLNNFYVAGLEWMVKNMKIDGVYVDDSALDRFTMQRVRKVIDAGRPAGRIDLHSWNHFNNWAGFANSLNLYLDLLPYIDLAWIGEGRDYDRDPDHWLIEVSGIPFGIPGQMLQGGGNPWRGMVYGITTRAGWTPNPPKYLWNFFDKYSFIDREMIGYWDSRCPVTSKNPNLKITVYKGSKDWIIAIGNWSNEQQKVVLNFDWKKMNIKPNQASLTVPEVSDFQKSMKITHEDEILIQGGKGLILILNPS